MLSTIRYRYRGKNIMKRSIYLYTDGELIVLAKSKNINLSNFFTSSLRTFLYGKEEQKESTLEEKRLTIEHEKAILIEKERLLKKEEEEKKGKEEEDLKKEWERVYI